MRISFSSAFTTFFQLICIKFATFFQLFSIVFATFFQNIGRLPVAGRCGKGAQAGLLYPALRPIYLVMVALLFKMLLKGHSLFEAQMAKTSS